MGLWGSESEVKGMLSALDPAYYSRAAVPYLSGYSTEADRLTLIWPSGTIVVGSDYLSLTSDTQLLLSNTAIWDNATYATAANRAGQDFYVYATADGLILSANATVPTGYTALTSRKIGGFHCLCVDVRHNISLGSWNSEAAVPIGSTKKATTWDGYMYRCTISGTTSSSEPVWSGYLVGATITDGTVTWIKEKHTLEGFLAGDILPQSIWDLKFRSAGLQEGTVYDKGADEWIMIYLMSGTGSLTESAYAATITDTRDWMAFVNDLAAIGMKLSTDSGFQSYASGSNEETNIAGSADPVTTGGHVDTAGRRMISNIGCEDCCGAMYQWLLDQSWRADSLPDTGDPTWSWYDLPGAKGSLHRQGSIGDVKLLAGGSWGAGSYCGSRCRNAYHSRWTAASTFGGRGCARSQVA